MTSILFEPKELGNVRIKNRIVRSATFEAMSDDGKVTDNLVNFYKTLAQGGTGLIITGHAFVNETGRNHKTQIAIDSDEYIPGLEKISGITHDYGEGCKIFMQISHIGRQSFHLKEPIAASAVYEPITKKTPRALLTDELHEIIEDYSNAVKRAKQANYDGVQFHAAHGWLLSGFLSPYTNKRVDEFGGDVHKRFRIIEEIYKSSVQKVGKDFPLIIKINGDDFLPGGITINESKIIAEKCSNLGFSAIELSGGMWEVVTRSEKELGWKPAMIPESRIGLKTKEDEAYNLPYSKEIMNSVNIPIILVGGIKSFDVAETILINNHADFIALSRPLIRSPDLPNKWLNGTGELSSDCISCNRCLLSLSFGGIKCLDKKT